MNKLTKFLLTSAILSTCTIARASELPSEITAGATVYVNQDIECGEISNNGRIDTEVTSGPKPAITGGTITNYVGKSLVKCEDDTLKTSNPVDDLENVYTVEKTGWISDKLNVSGCTVINQTGGTVGFSELYDLSSVDLVHLSTSAENESLSVSWDQTSAAIDCKFGDQGGSDNYSYGLEFDGNIVLSDNFSNYKHGRIKVLGTITGAKTNIRETEVHVPMNISGNCDLTDVVLYDDIEVENGGHLTFAGNCKLESGTVLRIGKVES